MGAGHRDAAGFRDEGWIDIVFAERHVSAVFAVEDQRKLVLVANAKQHQRCQALGIGHNAAHIDAFAYQLLANEAAHVLVCHARDDCALQAKSRGARGDIGR